METAIILKAILSLGAVFATMYVILKIVQRYSNVGTSSRGNTRGTGLKIENIVYIDEGTKVVNISNRSGANYVIAVGKNNSFLVDKYEDNKEEK
jgi:hypothetical protein